MLGSRGELIVSQDTPARIRKGYTHAAAAQLRRPNKTVYIPAGALKFGIEYRHLQGDQGICIHVFGEVNGREEEVLRFDCFQRAPHYHYAWSTNDQYVTLDTTADGDPFRWTLERLRTRLPAMLIRAGAPDLARTLGSA